MDCFGRTPTMYVDPTLSVHTRLFGHGNGTKTWSLIKASVQCHTHTMPPTSPSISRQTIAKHLFPDRHNLRPPYPHHKGRQRRLQRHRGRRPPPRRLPCPPPTLLHRPFPRRRHRRRLRPAPRRWRHRVPCSSSGSRLPRLDGRQVAEPAMQLGPPSVRGHCKRDQDWHD